MIACKNVSNRGVRQLVSVIYYLTHYNSEMCGSKDVYRVPHFKISNMYITQVFFHLTIQSLCHVQFKSSLLSLLFKYHLKSFNQFSHQLNFTIQSSIHAFLTVILIHAFLKSHFSAHTHVQSLVLYSCHPGGTTLELYIYIYILNELTLCPSQK